MAIGLSTYAFFWRSSDAAPRPLGLTAMLDETAALGASVFQICDFPAIESMTPAELRGVRDHARGLGITLELGTRGISLARLERYRELAAVLGVRLVRSMLRTADHQPSAAEAIGLLRQALPRYQAQGVTLGLETYEQVPTRDLVAVVRAVDSPNLGVCLDPGNCVARLEMPEYVIGQVAPYVVNVHVKDFTFTRQEGWVGFSLTGCPARHGAARLRRHDPGRPARDSGHQPGRRALAATSRNDGRDLPDRTGVDQAQRGVPVQPVPPAPLAAAHPCPD